MAKILVYRLEDIEGKGPYAASYSSAASLAHRKQGDSGGHWPDPWADKCDDDARKAFFKKHGWGGWHCAYATEEQFLTWWHKPEARAELGARGMRLVTYLVDEADVLVMRHQCIFVRRHAEKVAVRSPSYCDTRLETQAA